MRSIGVLKNTIQEYSWGSKTAIAGLLGQPGPAEKPQAELWMGAHPKAPSQVLCDGRWQSLLEVIQKNPEEVLGAEVAARFSGKLPFLFKVLAAARPLSIQAHPNKQQARRGYDLENTRGVPLNAPQRNYRDDNHKPEIICALTTFWALNGFRRIAEILSLLEDIEVLSLADEVDMLRRRRHRQGLREFFHRLLTLEEERRVQAVAEVLAAAEKRAGDPLFAWMIRLGREYPADIGILSTVLLNLVRLEPGQAMYLGPGELHAYLEGVGIELMANSDNVLRGGLTPKHVDVPELLAVLNFTDKEVEILSPERIVSGEVVYDTPAGEFVLSMIAVDDAYPFASAGHRSVEILLCTDGKARVTDVSNGECTDVPKGSSIIVPAAVGDYRIEGRATLYKAGVPTGKK